MNHEQASRIELGDTLYNCFMDKFKVVGINHNLNHDIDNNKRVLFTLLDDDQNRYCYYYKDLYLEDLSGETEEEKSWINWAMKNKDFLMEFDHIEATKAVYQQGFDDGLKYKKKYSFEEMMQK